MNRALWKKAFGEVWLTLPLFIVMMFGFQILFVWITSQVNLQFVGHFLQNLPEMWKKLLPVSVESMTTYEGRVAIGYVHPLVVFGLAFWAIARGSDAVSGPVGRGTMEMLLAQPVRRSAVLVSSIGVTVLGCILMSLANWLGTAAGLLLVEKMRGIPPWPYAFCALNVCCYAIFLSGLTTLLSSFDRSRARTIGLAVVIYVISMFLKFIGKEIENYKSLLYASFLSAFEPQQFLDSQFEPQALSLHYDLPLLIGGVICYALAIAIFSHRDIPAPL